MYKKFKKSTYPCFILAGDVGGTNTNLGLFGIKKDLPHLLISLHFKSNELKGIHEAINETLNFVKKEYSINITKACFAVAGVLSQDGDAAEVTNAKLDIDKKALLRKTKLKRVILLNDFEAMGHGIGILRKNDIAIIKEAKKIPKAPIAVIGAGTGLGKTTLIYNENNNSYVPLSSEAGHTDYPAQNQQELELINFIKKHKRIKRSVPYEQILSGQGLENIYLFLREAKDTPTKYTKEIDGSKDKAGLISKYRKIDATCKATFEIFRLAYAKFAKNFALDSMALGGVYIAGGIAPKNMDIFNKKFTESFEDNYMLGGVLRKIPIYLILNYNAGLLGAGLIGAKLLKG